MKKILASIILLFSLILLPSCGNKLCVKDLKVIHEEEFGGIYLTKTIEDFNALGFSFGDSVNITFSNGYKLKDLPYYSGYYVDADEKLLVGYPGYDYIKAAINYGDDLFTVANLKETDTATITLNKKAKYLDIQTSLDIHYYDEREKYTTDSEFANYREIKVGNIKEGILYRSASPCDNKHKRASFTDKLMEESNVNFIMNLADTPEKIQSYIQMDDFNSPYFLSLYQRNMLFLMETSNSDDKVIPLAMNMNYKSDEFREKIALGFTNMSKTDGAYLIHCLEGKDRTGFVCMVIEALMHATYQEMVDDYMLTYDNYYGIDINDKRYEVIKKRNIDSMLMFISNKTKLDKDMDYSDAAKTYLLNGGMTIEDINILVSKLGK